MLLALKAIDPLYPIASYFGDIGHPRATNKAEERAYVVGLISQWFGYYLRGSGTEPAHVVRAAITNKTFSEDDVVTVNNYAELATSTVTKDFGGSATLVNPLTDPLGGLAWDPVIMEGAQELQPLPVSPDSAVVPGSLVAFTVPVAELAGGASLLIAGQPEVSLVASTGAPRVELNIRLFDVAPDGTKQIVTRGTFLLEGPANGRVTIPTYGNFWEAAAGHTLRVEISNVDSPYLTPSRVPSATLISQVSLQVPVRPTWR